MLSAGCPDTHVCVTHQDILTVRLQKHPGGSGDVVVLQRGVVAVCDGKRVGCLDEEIIIEAAMLVVMD